MTVEELIEELLKMPKDKRVEIGTMTHSCGKAVRVIEYGDFVDIESNECDI